MFQQTGNSRTFSRRSIHGQVAHEIGMRIVRGDYAPGSILPTEVNFSADLSVSRTAYREALMVLAAKGLVEARPRTGTRVRPRDEWNMLDPDILAWIFSSGPSEEQIRSLFEIRSIIEPAAAELAASRATNPCLEQIKGALESMKAEVSDIDASVAADLHFHQSILRAAGNELLTPLGYLIESALAESFRLSDQIPGARENSIPLHEAVYVAIRDKQPEQARNAMKYLLGEALDDVSDALSSVSKKTKSKAATKS